MRVYVTGPVAVAVILTDIESAMGAIGFATTDVARSTSAPAANIRDTMLDKKAVGEDRAWTFAPFGCVGELLDVIFGKVRLLEPVASRIGKLYTMSKWDTMYGYNPDFPSKERASIVDGIKSFMKNGASPSEEQARIFATSYRTMEVLRQADRLASSSVEFDAECGRKMLELLPQVWLKAGKSVDDVFKELYFSYNSLNYKKLELLETFIELHNEMNGREDTLVKTLVRFYGDYELLNFLARDAEKKKDNSAQAQALRKKLIEDWTIREITVKQFKSLMAPPGGWTATYAHDPIDDEAIMIWDLYRKQLKYIELRTERLHKKELIE